MAPHIDTGAQYIGSLWKNLNIPTNIINNKNKSLLRYANHV